MLPSVSPSAVGQRRRHDGTDPPGARRTHRTGVNESACRGLVAEHQPVDEEIRFAAQAHADTSAPTEPVSLPASVGVGFHLQPPSTSAAGPASTCRRPLIMHTAYQQHFIDQNRDVLARTRRLLEVQLRNSGGPPVR